MVKTEGKGIPCDPKDFYVNGPDPVNHPQHYTSGSIECIDAMLETQGMDATQAFCICNAFKYLWRHTRKNGVEDIKKAIWYLTKFVEIEERRTSK